MYVLVTTREGEEVEVEARVGMSLMKIIRDSGVDELVALCGGCRSCATCHIYVDEEWTAKLPAASEDERDLLEASDYRTELSRLSCQIEFTEKLSGLQIAIAPEE